MTDPQVARAADIALPLIQTSTASWGVRTCHWLPERDGRPALWLTTGTEAQRLALEGQVWLSSQVTMMLTRQGMPYDAMRGLRVFVDSLEGQRRLLTDDTV